MEFDDGFTVGIQELEMNLDEENEIYHLNNLQGTKGLNHLPWSHLKTDCGKKISPEANSETRIVRLPRIRIPLQYSVPS